MTLADIATLFNHLTKTTTTTCPAADRLVFLNNSYDDIQTLILQSQDEWDFDDSNNTDFPILTADTVTDQADYALPSGTLKIKRVETTFDGTNWYRVAPLDINEVNNDTTNKLID